MASVLIVEADPTVRRLIVERFRREDHEILAERNRLTVADLATFAPDLLVLEVEAGADLEALRLVRRRSQVPTIVVLAAESDHDEVAALDAGADDVLRKPLSLRDLMARSRAVLRRGGMRRDGGTLEFPCLVIDRATRLVHVGGEPPIELPHREFDLLVHLADSPGQVFSREQLLEHVWGSSDAWQGTATVTEHVYRLRRHLGPAMENCISTVRSVGYRFTPPAADHRPRRAPALRSRG
jgi:two-component system response regulator ResD